MAKPKPRNGLIAALDVGTTKVVCFIARAEPDGALRVLGIGHHLSRGIRNGAVVDMDDAESGIRAAVAAAEDMAGEHVRDIVVNVSGGHPSSSSVAVEIHVGGHAVGESDIRRMVEHGRQHAHAEPPDRDLIHVVPVGYTIDGNEGIRDPHGMYGERLGVSLHLIHAGAGAMRNLTTVVHRCHLDIESRVVSSYAAALACLVDDEKDLGVTCIDMGGGTTSIAVFTGGELVHTDVVAVGGLHVTNDIARVLSTPVVHAERMKTLYGSAIASASDDREILKVPLVGEDEDGTTNQVPRSMLVQIVQPRLEETFELVRNHLEARGFDKVAGRRVVITGGASQIQGVRDLAATVLDKQVRLGKPVGLAGLTEASGGPAFATCAGLLRYALSHESEAPPKRPPPEPTGPFGKLGLWLRKNF